MKINKNIPFILKIYILGILIFSIFRVLLFVLQYDNAALDKVGLTTIFSAFVMGLRFDIVISGYIIIFPAFTLFLISFFTNKDKLIKRIFFYWIFIFFSIAFMISAADIPYFHQFFERFSVGAFEWLDNLDFVLAMIVQEPSYILFLLLFIVLDILYWYALKWIFKSSKTYVRPNIFINIITVVLFLAFMFLGIRGRIAEKSPIRVGTAYFSDNAFLNKMGLNPVFTLIRTYLDSQKEENKTVHLLSSDLALRNTKNYLHLKNTNLYNTPIARKVQYDSLRPMLKPNIVVVIMESMSAAKMNYFGNKEQLTPFLDSLAYKSLFFDNFFSAGKHTFNGIFSTLFSFPALYRQHTLRNIRQYDGFAPTLKKIGYSTTYFTTHDGQFDNVAGFLKANHFDNIFSQKDYPSEEVKTTLGVPDDYMFRYAIPVIDTLARSKKPFFVSFMTTSDHGPFYVPDYFKPKTKKIRTQITEYADWSLQQFIIMASKQDWFDNTIFVFVADHGAPMNVVYDIPLNYFHVPLLIYAPKLIGTPKVLNKTGSQLDIFPTVMGIINQSYINNTMGIDLLNDSRPYAIINDDNKIGIVDQSYLCVMKNKGKELSLYNYKSTKNIDIINSNKAKATEMSDYAKSILQVTQDMILAKDTYIHPNDK